MRTRCKIYNNKWKKEINKKEETALALHATNQFHFKQIFTYYGGG